MRLLSLEGSKSMRVRELVMLITSKLTQKDYRAEACMALEYCRDEIRYVKDMRTVEVIQTPDITLQLGGGDCDDKSILLGAMLTSIGHKVRFIAVSFTPGQYSHVWVQDFVNGKWLDLEATEPLSCGDRIPETGAVKYLTLDV